MTLLHDGGAPIKIGRYSCTIELLDMKKNIYEIALECKKYSTENIKIIIRSNKILVVGANKNYESLLIELCDTIDKWNPKVSSLLRSHIVNYDAIAFQHQIAIDSIVDTILTFAEPCINQRKFFISHASADKKIIEAFYEKILMLGCGFQRQDIFCTLNHSDIRTGDDFRNEIVNNMKNCDYVLCFISNNYKKSEVCQNEMGAAWVLEDKRLYPFKFPNVDFTELGFIAKVKQTADITDKSKLDEFYIELCQRYNLQQDWMNFNKQKEDFVGMVNDCLGLNGNN